MDNKEQIQTKEKSIKIMDCIFLAVLVLLPFLHLAFGVEFTDTAYSLGNYENLENMNMTWTIATFWANMLGKLFTKLPMGSTWIGMKFYTTLVPVSGVVMSYFFLKKSIPRVIVFIGELLAISLFWCPTTILYNYLTYLLFTAAIIVLITALSKDSKIGLLIAGIILAFNVFVRFPNVTEVALILVVWLDARVEKKKFVNALWDTAICVGGFLIGLFINVGFIGLRYGFSSIPEMIVSLFNMTGSNTGYKPTQMVWTIIRGYTTYYKSFIFLVGITVICFAASALMKRHYARIITIVAQFILYALFLIWAYRNHVYTARYHEYSSMYFWMVIFFILANIISIWTILRKRNEKEHKLIAMAVLIVIWITPLGSNNALYPSINNLFIVAPAVLFMWYNEMLKGRNFFEILDLESRNTMVASRITVALLMISIMIHCMLFGIIFIFRDSGFPYKNHTPVKNNEVLVHMHTNPERAAIIDELSLYVKENNLTGHEAIFYGEIPGLEYILKMPCAISHTWPDLGSFTFEEFKNDIDNLQGTPVIFINEDYCADIYSLDGEADNKEILLSEYMADNEYELRIRIENIAVYMAR